VISAAVSGQIAEIDPEQVIIAGDSAGAHLATTSTLWLRDRGLPQPALQMLFAPVVDLREVDEVMATYASRREFHDGPYITEDHFRWYDKAFVSELSDEERRGDLVSPILAEDLSGIAPAYVAVAGHDPLRDEGEAYAARLDEAGVPVTARRHRGLVHPFVNSSVIWSGSGRALDEAVGAVRHVLSI
jgi:acetyl esterase